MESRGITTTWARGMPTAREVTGGSRSLWLSHILLDLHKGPWTTKCWQYTAIVLSVEPQEGLRFSWEADGLMFRNEGEAMWRVTD